MSGKLVPIEGPARQPIVVPQGKKFSFGRAPDSDLVVHDVTVSRIHCYLYHTEAGLVVEDNNSSNGTFVNGKLTHSGILRNGDELRVGPVALRYVQKPVTGQEPNAEHQVTSEMGRPEAAPSGDDRSGQVLAGYEILGLLGRGAIGTVYKARQVSLERLVALKVLNPNMTTQETAVKRFLREARTGAKIRHPNVVSLYDQGEVDGQYYIAMEFVNGQTLLNIVATQGPLGQDRAAAIFMPICEALFYAHEEGIVHRDIKPANIMVAQDGTPKLTDMGLAKSLADSAFNITAPGVVVGTPGYISPEQVLDLDVIDHRADIFGLGASLYFAVTGLPPFIGKTPVEIMKRSTAEEPAPPEQFNPSVTKEFGQVIRTALAKKAPDRFQTALEMAEALAAFV